MRPLEEVVTKTPVGRPPNRWPAPRSARERLAYHEAGHVVVGVMLRWAIRTVSIAPEGYLTGYVRHPRTATDYWSAEDIARYGPLPPLSEAASRIESVRYTERATLRRRRARIEIAVILAGRKAEMRFTGRWQHWNGTSDCFQTRDSALQLAAESSATADEIIEDEGLRADRLLAENWSSVEAVATALLGRSCLTGRQVRAIVKSSKQKRY